MNILIKELKNYPYFIVQICFGVTMSIYGAIAQVHPGLIAGLAWIVIALQGIRHESLQKQLRESDKMVVLVARHLNEINCQLIPSSIAEAEKRGDYKTAARFKKIMDESIDFLIEFEKPTINTDFQ